jgi:predicted DNA-binding protein (MmcQ/YjbR family)
VNIETLRNYCIAKPGITESFPFGEDTLVFKISDKIFLLTSLSQPNRFKVKCDPEIAVILREEHPEIIPGYHMNKRHWNTVYLDGNLPENLIKQQIDQSYNLVFKSLPKSKQQEIIAS